MEAQQQKMLGLDPAIAFGMARAGLAHRGLPRRLGALQGEIERHYPLLLAIDLVNRDAIDRLPPDLADATFAVLEEAAMNVARHAKASFARLTVQLNGGVLLLSIEDDGKGFPFIGIYDLGVLAMLGVGPRRLAQQVEGLHGTMSLISRVIGTRIDIALPCGETNDLPRLLQSAAAWPSSISANEGGRAARLGVNPRA